jgi:hypothetical protein
MKKPTGWGAGGRVVVFVVEVARVELASKYVKYSATTGLVSCCTLRSAGSRRPALHDFPFGTLWQGTGTTLAFETPIDAPPLMSHGYGMCCDVKPEHVMEKVLFTIDELTGLITACAIMRPSRSVLDLELKSVKKKYKDHRFAAGVNREVIEKGAAMLGMDLDYVITETILGMREVAEAIGLKREL